MTDPRLGDRRPDQRDPHARRPFASRKIHSAPARVLPNPRPAIISQVRQPSPLGGSWFRCAHISKSASSFNSCSGVAYLNARLCCSSVAFFRIAISWLSTP